MDPLMIAAAGGMSSRMDSLDLLANNLANADTAGYKSDREFYSLFTGVDAEHPLTTQGATVPVVEKSWTDFTQGALRQSANPLDLAIEGKGFFAVDSHSGVAYTRNGSFRLSSAGTLVSPEGYPVRSISGSKLQLSPNATIEISQDGTITQSGQTVGRIGMFDFADPQMLTKQGSNYYRVAGNAAPRRATSALLLQGKLEGSNVGSAESAVRLVGIMRQFEMLQKAAAIGAEMNAKAIEDVARVGS